MTVFIIKSSIYLFLMYGLFWFLLRKEKLFHFNRFFLLLAILLSLILPLIPFQINLQNASINDIVSTYNNSLVHESVTSMDSFVESQPGSNNAQNSNLTNLSLILVIIYIIGAVLFLFRFVRNVNVIIRRMRLNKILKFDGYKIVLTNERTTPCCFLRTIFVNKEDYYNKRIEAELLNHELGHVTQLHTIDILFIEVLKIIYWFNPLLLIYDRAIRINHEYLADNSVVKHKLDKTTYANILLITVLKANNLALTSSSNYLYIKNRIIMLTKANPRGTFASIRIALTISLMLFISTLLSFQQKGQEVKGFVINKYGKYLSGVQIDVSGQNSKVVTDAFGHFVIKNVAENARLTFSTDNYKTQSLIPVFTAEMVVKLEVDKSNEEIRKNYTEYFPTQGSNPVIVINGVIEERLSMADIDPSNGVASIIILPGNEAIKKYGEKVKNGAIEIVTEASTQKNKESIRLNTPESSLKTLFIVDGKVYNGDINSIRPESIESISVRNYTSVYDKYGESGKEKVIEIKTN